MQQHGSDRMAIRPLIPLGLAAFAGFLNIFGMNPFFVAVADDIDSTVSMVGYTSTIAMLVTGVAALIIGPLAERIGVRRILVIGLMLAAGGAITTALALSFESLVLSRMLAGVGGAITGGVTISAAALFYSGRQRERALAIITVAAALAVVVGVFLMTLMAEPYGWRGAYIILGVALVLIGFLNWSMLSPDERQGAPPSTGIGQFLAAYRPVLGQWQLRRLFSGATLQQATLNGATAYIGAYLISQHGVSTQTVGLAFSVVGITYSVGNLVAGNLGRVPKHAVFSCAVLFGAAFWLGGYTLPVSPLVSAGLFGLATFLAGIAWVTLLHTVADRSPDSLGTAMVFTSSLQSFGGALGIALSAALLDITGYSGLAVGMVLLAVVGAVLGWVGPPERDASSAPDWVPRRQGMPEQEHL